jgi:hypothetical protein
MIEILLHIVKPCHSFITFYPQVRKEILNLGSPQLFLLHFLVIHQYHLYDTNHTSVPKFDLFTVPRVIGAHLHRIGDGTVSLIVFVADRR